MEQCCQNFRAPNRGKLAFLLAISNFIEKPNLYQVILLISQIWVLLSHQIIKIPQLGEKTMRLLTSAWSVKSILIDLQDVHLNPWNWWKKCSWPLKRLKNSLNWQKTGKFEEKRAATGRQMKSSPILGHPPNSILTHDRRFQSSPIWREHRSFGNTALEQIKDSYLTLNTPEEDKKEHVLLGRNLKAHK